ncbi:hypothetical protein DFH09DRAFT_1365019, partial [Mycena vulgaris]
MRQRLNRITKVHRARPSLVLPYSIFLILASSFHSTSSLRSTRRTPLHPSQLSPPLRLAPLLLQYDTRAQPPSLSPGVVVDPKRATSIPPPFPHSAPHVFCFAQTLPRWRRMLRAGASSASSVPPTSAELHLAAGSRDPGEGDVHGILLLSVPALAAALASPALGSSRDPSIEPGRRCARYVYRIRARWWWMRGRRAKGAGIEIVTTPTTRSAAQCG